MSVVSNVPKDTSLRIRAASTLTLTAIVKQGGSVVDLTGSTITGKIGATVLTGTLTNPTAGEFTLEIPPSAVPTATETTWYVDWVDSLSRVTPLFRGPASVI